MTSKCPKCGSKRFRYPDAESKEITYKYSCGSICTIEIDKEKKDLDRYVLKWKHCKEVILEHNSN